MSYLAKFPKQVHGEEHLFYKWVTSDLIYNHTNEHHTIHNTLIRKIEEEQLEGSGVEFQDITEARLEIYKIRDIKASSWVELPPNYKNNKSILNIKNDDQY